MYDYQDIQKVRALYEQGGNIMQYLKEKHGVSENLKESVLISYDFQAGSYIEFAKEQPEFISNYTGALARVIDQLSPDSVLDAGVGEATTLCNMIDALSTKPRKVYGFDLSWSRIKCARKYSKRFPFQDLELVTGDMFAAPFHDNAFDVVYTSHAIEPNGGNERPLLEELYRITGRYLVLLEPAYDLAEEKAKRRMQDNGYTVRIFDELQALRFNLVEHRLFEYCANPLNPTGLTIIEKSRDHQGSDDRLACPLSKTSLHEFEDCFFSKESMLAYPKIDKIPCFLPQNAILATHFESPR